MTIQTGAAFGTFLDNNGVPKTGSVVLVPKWPTTIISGESYVGVITTAVQVPLTGGYFEISGLTLGVWEFWSKFPDTDWPTFEFAVEDGVAVDVLLAAPITEYEHMTFVVNEAVALSANAAVTAAQAAQAAAEAAVAGLGVPEWVEITGKPSTFPPEAHTHDDRYFTESEVTSALSGKSDTAHTHAYSALTGIPSTFAPSAHSHDDLYFTESEVTSALSGKVGTDDARLTDSRTPLAHKASHATAGSDALRPDDIIPTLTTATAAATAAKVITSAYQPVAGDLVRVVFTLGNSASTATLNVNGVGAKNIRIANASATSVASITAAGGMLFLYFDGTYYHLLGSQRNSDTTVSVATGAEVSTGTDNTKFASAKAIKDSLNVPNVVPSTAGNVMQSNGTNWTSAALDLSAYLTSVNAPELIRDTIGTALVAGTNVTITPDDNADTITIAASGGGGSTVGDVQFTVGGRTETITLGSGSFTTYPLSSTPSVNTGGGVWESEAWNYTYVIPVTGLYLCLGGVRMNDGQPSRSVAVAIGTTNEDAAHVLWGDVGGSRPGRQYTRLARFTVGDRVRLYIYSDAAGFITKGDGQGSFLSLIRLAD